LLFTLIIVILFIFARCPTYLILSRHEDHGRWTFYLNFYLCSVLSTDPHYKLSGFRLWDFPFKNHIVKLSSDSIMKRPRVSRTKKTTGEQRN